MAPISNSELGSMPTLSSRTRAWEVKRQFPDLFARKLPSLQRANHDRDAHAQDGLQERVEGCRSWHEVHREPSRGSFTLHRDSTRPAVFLAGGIGIAPIRSILQCSTQERLPHKLYLFYSNREADDAAFIEELESMTGQNPNFTLVPTVTGHKTLAWPYEKGHINREMLTRYLLGLNGPVYYIAGPSGMVTAMTNLLNSSASMRTI